MIKHIDKRSLAGALSMYEETGGLGGDDLFLIFQSLKIIAISTSLDMWCSDMSWIRALLLPLGAVLFSQSYDVLMVFLIPSTPRNTECSIYIVASTMTL